MPEPVARGLRCPHCGAGLARAGTALRCARGHRYDIARQGHVSLLPPRGRRHVGDSAAMVAAREAFLAAGHYAPIARAITAAAQSALGPAAAGPRCIVDLGAGTGYYLAAVLAARADWRAIALDASTPALRRAVRASPRITGVACDVWEALPVEDAVAGLVLNVFAPRNPPEIARILAPHGALVVVTPSAEHLRELIPTLGLLTVEPDKGERLRERLAPDLAARDRREVEFVLALGREDVGALLAMGPSARHRSDADRQRRLRDLPEAVKVTASVVVETFRHA